ncbi:MAG: MbcA/ParS/Xre antitoxin family protein [Pseudolabrys sp.]
MTEDVFGDAQKANRWLRENLAILDGQPPLEIARTESGARVVEQMLAKIDWGGVMRLWRLSSLRRARDFDWGYGLTNSGRWNTTGAH